MRQHSASRLRKNIRGTCSWFQCRNWCCLHAAPHGFLLMETVWQKSCHDTKVSPLKLCRSKWSLRDGNLRVWHKRLQEHLHGRPARGQLHQLAPSSPLQLHLDPHDPSNSRLPAETCVQQQCAPNEALGRIIAETQNPWPAPHPAHGGLAALAKSALVWQAPPGLSIRHPTASDSIDSVAGFSALPRRDWHGHCHCHPP